MTHLDRSDLTPERLLTLLDAAAIVGRVEEDGDLYLTGEGVDFPLWLSVSPDKGHIRSSPLPHWASGLDDHTAIAYANRPTAGGTGAPLRRKCAMVRCGSVPITAC